MRNLILILVLFFAGCLQPKAPNQKFVKFLDSDQNIKNLKFTTNLNAPKYPKIKDQIGFVLIDNLPSALYFMGNDGSFPLSIAVFSAFGAVDMLDPNSLDFIKTQKEIKFYEFGFANIKSIKFKSQDDICKSFEFGNLNATSVLNFYLEENEFVSFIFDLNFSKNGSKLLNLDTKIFANNLEKAQYFIDNFKEKISQNELKNTEQILKNIICYIAK